MPSDTPNALATKPSALATLAPSQATLCLAHGSTTLVRMTPRGLIRAMVSSVKLYPDLGHTYELQGKKRITAAGYNQLNKFIGATFFRPTTVTGDDGNEHGNPYQIFDGSGALKRIVVRCVGIYRNAVGNTAAIDSTLDYNLEACVAQDFLKQWRDKGWQGAGKQRAASQKDWGVMLSTENIPDDVRKDPKKKCIQLPGGVTLVVELRDEVLDVMAEHANRVRFASRNAETVVNRNILKKIIGTDAVGSDMTVKVTSWQQADRESMQDIADVVETTETGVFVIDGEPVAAEQQEVVVDDADDEKTALAGEHDEEAATDDPEPSGAGVGPVEPTPVVNPDIVQRRATIRDLYGKLPQEAAAKAVADAGLEGLEEVSRLGDVGLLDDTIRKLNEALLRDVQARKSKQTSKGEAKLDLKA